MSDCIACIEDDPVQQRAYRAILERRGYEVDIYPTGADALAGARQHRHSLFIIDLNLPDMSGLDVIRRLQRLPGYEQLPFVVVSASESESAITESLQLGALDYMIKPFRPTELVAKIGSIVNREALGKLSHLRAPTEPLFAGKYRLVNKLGSGGSSTVYQAIAHDTNTFLAVKVFEASFSQAYEADDLMTRFLREAYQLSKLRHPNIVTLRDFGRTSNGHFYLAMDYVEGMTLQDILVTYGELPESQVAFVGYELAGVLDYLDTEHLIHRDFTPRNVMISNEGDVKVIDMGLARTHLDELQPEADLLVGSPLFIAPELLDGDKEPTVASDIYSLGVTLYLCLYRRTPFHGNAQQIVEQRRTRSLRPLREARPEVNPVLIEAVDSMLAVDPEVRPAPLTLRERLGTILLDGDQ